MRKLITLLLAIIMICSTFVGCDWKSIFQKDKDSTSYSKGLEIAPDSRGDYVVMGIGTCTDKNIIIPSEYEGHPVLGIHFNAFMDCSFIESVIIPNSVRYICSKAFKNCTSLTSIKISDSVLSIGEYVFDGCTSLVSIEIPSSIKDIDKYTFNNCTSLQKIIFEDPSNWNCREMQYDAIYDLYRVVYIPIEEDLSNPEIAAQLLTSTYVDDILQKIE